VQAEDAAAAAALLIEASHHYARLGSPATRPGRARRRRIWRPAPRRPTRRGWRARPPRLRPGAGVRGPSGACRRSAADGERVDGLEARPTFERPPVVEESLEESVRRGRPRRLRACASNRLRDPRDLGDAGVVGHRDLLRLAAERFKRGERDLAGDALIEAARAYEALERLESAAAIYRSLGRSTHATPEVLALWLRNSEQRGDAREAAEVACGLGDRALNDGDVTGAREWFARALHTFPITNWPPAGCRRWDPARRSPLRGPERLTRRGHGSRWPVEVASVAAGRDLDLAR